MVLSKKEKQLGKKLLTVKSGLLSAQKDLGSLKNKLLTLDKSLTSLNKQLLLSKKREGLL